MANLLTNIFGRSNGYHKVVVVTGASAGVGRATVREFAKKGYRIGLLARGIDGLKATRKDVEELGGEALIIPTDVSDYNQVEYAATKVEEAFGSIDIWVNNAMTSVFSPIKEMKPEEFKRVTDVTYLGQVNGALVALKRMLPRNKGSIVFVGSALAYRGIPLQSAYCGAKHAIQGFYDSLRTELMHDKSKVQVSMVELPALNTPQFGWVKSRLPKKARPMGKIYQPEVAAKAILYAAEHDKREMYVGLSTIQAIVGNKIAPWAGDMVLAKNGYKGQQTNEPESINRPDNLWEPVLGDHGAHGTFDEKATDAGVELWLTMHKGLVAAGAAAAIATGVIVSLLSKENEAGKQVQAKVKLTAEGGV